eukprot:18288-Eustigmatos_ZCMA.PRE.1
MPIATLEKGERAGSVYSSEAYLQPVDCTLQLLLHHPAVGQKKPEHQRDSVLWRGHDPPH